NSLIGPVQGAFYQPSRSCFVTALHVAPCPRASLSAIPHSFSSKTASACPRCSAAIAPPQSGDFPPLRKRGSRSAVLFLLPAAEPKRLRLLSSHQPYVSLINNLFKLSAPMLH